MSGAWDFQPLDTFVLNKIVVAVISSGFAGLGLGATPVAIANMSAITGKYGASPKAFLVVPLIGAFFIDILNASVIRGFLFLIVKFVGVPEMPTG